MSQCSVSEGNKAIRVMSHTADREDTQDRALGKMKFSLQDAGPRHCTGVAFVHRDGPDFCHGNGTEIYPTRAIVFITDW